MAVRIFSEGNMDGIWIDGYLSDPVKMFEAGKKYAARYTRKYQRPGSILEMEHPFMAAVAWLGTQPGMATFYIGLDGRGYLDRGTYPWLFQEMENDNQRQLYRAVIMVRDTYFGRLGLGRQGGAQKLLERWGFEAKEEATYPDYSRFAADCDVVLEGVVEPFVGAKSGAKEFLDRSGLTGPGAAFFTSRPTSQKL